MILRQDKKCKMSKSILYNTGDLQGKKIKISQNFLLRIFNYIEFCMSKIKKKILNLNENIIIFNDNHVIFNDTNI